MPWVSRTLRSRAVTKDKLLHSFPAGFLDIKACRRIILALTAAREGGRIRLPTQVVHRSLGRALWRPYTGITSRTLIETISIHRIGQDDTTNDRKRQELAKNDDTPASMLHLGRPQRAFESKKTEAGSAPSQEGRRYESRLAAQGLQGPQIPSIRSTMKNEAMVLYGMTEGHQDTRKAVYPK